MNINEYPAKLTDSYYYVCTTWEDKNTQLGRYRTLKSAIAKADANLGSFVFAGDGISIYPEDKEAVTVSEKTEEISLDASEPTQDEPEGAEGTEDNDVAEVEAVKTDSDASEEGTETELTEEEIAAAQIETLAEDEYPSDGNTTPVLYARANTLLNIRDGNTLDAKKVALIRKGEIAEVLEVCDNGWYRIKCDKAECSYGYVSNAMGTYFSLGKSLYTVQAADSLWKIAEKLLGSGTKYTEIRTANGLTSNVIRVGMKLLIP